MDTTIENETSNKKMKEDHDTKWNDVLSYVEVEIWAKGENLWKHSTTGGFAEELVELGLCENVKVAKREIRNIFESSEFSISRVLKWFFQNKDISDSSIQELYEEVNTYFGSGGMEEAEVRKHLMLLKSKGTLLKNTDIDDADDQAFQEFDEDVNLLINILVKPENLKQAAGRAHLDQVKVTNLKQLHASSILSAFGILKELDSRRSNIIGRIQKERNAKLEKKFRTLVPLTIPISSNLRQAHQDLMELLQITTASRISIPKGFRVVKKSNMDFEIDHPLSKARFVPFAKHQIVQGWFHTSLHGAAFIVQNGYPFSATEGKIILNANQNADSEVCVLFKVALDKNHCYWEDFEEGQDENICMELEVYDSCALMPIRLLLNRIKDS